MKKRFFVIICAVAFIVLNIFTITTLTANPPVGEENNDIDKPKYIILCNTVHERCSVLDYPHQSCKKMNNSHIFRCSHSACGIMDID